MATEIIQVTPEMLTKSAGDLQSYKTEHETAMRRLRTLILGLNEQWKGSASDTFLKKYTDMKPEFDKFASLLQDHIDHMKKAAQELKSKDEELASSIGKFSVNLK